MENSQILSATKSPDLDEISDRYVSGVRDAPVDIETIFRSETQKYYLETLVWYATNKIHSLQYHRDRLFEIVDASLRKLSDDIGGLPDIKPGNLRNSEAISTVINEDERVGFDVSAMLGSIRTLLDFVAKIISCYLKSQKHRSINTLQNYLSRFRLGQLSSLISSEWSEWIEYVRD